MDLLCGICFRRPKMLWQKENWSSWANRILSQSSGGETWRNTGKGKSPVLVTDLQGEPLRFLFILVVLSLRVWEFVWDSWIKISHYFFFCRGVCCGKERDLEMCVDLRVIYIQDTVIRYLLDRKNFHLSVFCHLSWDTIIPQD